MSSRNSKKSSGLRFLWIPGSRKSHPKGRFSATNKQVSYTTRQKKSEVWSLGGSRAQQSLLEANPDTTLLDGPSTSGLTSLACATAAGGGVAAAASSTQHVEIENSSDARNEKSSLDNNQLQQQQNSPSTPNSSSSTAPLISPPQSPFEQNIPLSNNALLPSITSNTTTTTTTHTMAEESHQPIPVLVTATTTADIMEENRYSLLATKDVATNEFDVFTLPSPPSNNINSQENLNNSSGSTFSQRTSSGSPHKNGSANNSPVKNKYKHRNHNNNQGDVNSIESITEDTVSDKIPSGDLDWLDNLELQNRDILAKPVKRQHAKELDQLDGVPIKETINDSSLKEEDDKVVKCLYYTLMCCECSIS